MNLRNLGDFLRTGTGRSNSEACSVWIVQSRPIVTTAALMLAIGAATFSTELVILSTISLPVFGQLLASN